MEDTAAVLAAVRQQLRIPEPVPVIVIGGEDDSRACCCYGSSCFHNYLGGRNPTGWPHTF
jgi:hypothetical protein